MDQTHRLIFNTVYELPFHRAQKGPAGRLLGGWQVGVILSLMSDGPLGISQATNTSFSQGGGQRPNWSGVSVKLSSLKPERWFDTSRFTPPVPYTFGNFSRTLGGLRSEAIRQLDISLVKGTRLLESMQLQFRAEAFNLTNTVRFSPTNRVLLNAQFGVVSALGNRPRVVQFALKLIY